MDPRNKTGSANEGAPLVAMRARASADEARDRDVGELVGQHFGLPCPESQKAWPEFNQCAISSVTRDRCPQARVQVDGDFAKERWESPLA